MTVDIFYSHVESRKKVLSTVSRTKLSTVTLTWIATFNEVAAAILDLFVWKLLGALVSLAPLAKPMVIESKYMSLSQIQKELLPYKCFHEVAAAILD